MSKFILQNIPPVVELETKKVLKKCILANRYLAELKGVAGTIPNETILINTLSLQEAKDSSAIENIITTHDDIFKEELFSEFVNNASAKEVRNYSLALKKGFELVKAKKFLTNSIILEIQEELEKNKAGFRKLPGTELKNVKTNEVVYVPPQTNKEINDLMSNLEEFINNNEISNLDILVKMAVIHFQFESIHPFYDGNGRTGRIINILYLVQQELLDIPILYLSGYIIKTKDKYYKYLQEVRDNNNWENWILYILDGIIEISKDTILIINKIKDIMASYKKIIRENYKFYSQDLLNNLFFHPYTKIDFLVKDLGITRKTAAKYLDELSKASLLKKEKVGVNYFYINKALFDIFRNKEV
jgi:Fic family protein